MRCSRVLLLIGCGVLIGCVAVRHAPLPESEASRLGGKVVQRSVYPTPDFAAYTAGKAAFGVVGAALVIKAGNDVVRENAVDDPALRIGQELVGALAERRGLKVLQTEPTVSKSDDIGALSSSYADADLILDVKTLNWMFIYFPTDWSHYRVVYSARLRLIDRSRQRVIAEDVCAYKPEYADTKKAPTREELVANGAAGLKQELAKAADYCLAAFRANAFGM